MLGADRKLVWLGYGCATLSLFFGGTGLGLLITILIGVAGFAIGVFSAFRGRPRNGIAIVVISLTFAYLGTTGFRQGLVEGFEQGYQAGRHATQGQP